MHRYLNKKYGKLVITYIITKSKNYYILDTSLASSILKDSPILFEAGIMKKEFFNKFMPNNLGISNCKQQKCPWKKRRIFNEQVLGTKKHNSFFSCISNIISKNLQEAPKNINDFKKLSFKIAAETIFGSNEDYYCNLLMNYINKLNTVDNIKDTKFYQKYQNIIHQGYINSNPCSLLFLSKIHMNDNIKIIDDQIPHWFGPLIFIFSFLIPILLCIVINNKKIYQKILAEINSEFDIYSNQTYLHFCVIEHIRLFNTININIQRTVSKDLDYQGIKFKKGDQIFILFSSLLRNSKQFPNPDQFIPERWIGVPVTKQDIVFGIGPQQCPSVKITPIYYKAAIYHILKKFNYIDVKPYLVSKDLYFINPYDIEFYLSLREKNNGKQI